MSGYLHPEYLVDTAWLAAHLGDADLRVYDCTTFLRPHPDPMVTYTVESGAENYAAGHIPGAVFLDIQADLSDPESKLRFTFPDAELFAAAVGAKGLGDDARVVLYSADNMQWATRVWWMLRAFGFDRAAVLDGGLQKWRAEGRALSTDPASYPPATFTAKPRPALIAGRDAVLAALDDPGTVIVNALRRDLHSGESERHYGRPGRIPGSVCLPAGELLDADDNTFLPAVEARARFAAIGVDVDRPVITYCGGGIAASLDAFVLAMLGAERIALYDNSMSEWARDPALPMETG